MRKLFKPIRHRMDDFDIDQQELSKMTGISQSTISNRLNGTYPFKTREIKVIAEVLEIPPEEYHQFFFDSDDPNAIKPKNVHRFSRAI